MKNLKFVFAAALVALVASCGPKKIGDVEAPSRGLTDSTSYLIGVNFGYFIKANGFGENLDYAVIKEGILDFVNNEYDMRDSLFNEQFRISPDAMNAVLSAYIEKVQAYAAAEAKAEGEAFLRKNLKKDGVVETESGLQYKVLEPGNDVRATAASKVRVNYKGTLIDGTEFDSGEGVEFNLSGVIKGWTEGMCLVGEGGHVMLYIPSELAYGDRQMGGSIKPGSTLIFDVELINVLSNPASEATVEE